MSRNDEIGRGAPERQGGTRATQQYTEQGSGWFGHESGGASQDQSRNQSGTQSDRAGQFGDRGSGRGGYMGGREGGSGGMAGFMSGGHDQTGNWQGAREDQGRDSSNYAQSGYGQRREEQGTTGSRDAPAEYQHQGGTGVTAQPYSHRGEGGYGQGDFGRRGEGNEGGYGQPRTAGQRSQPGYGSSQYAGYGPEDFRDVGRRGYGGESRESNDFGASGYGARNQGAYGADRGTRGGEQYDGGERLRREERFDYRAQSGRGGGYGGGEEWRDRHPQQEQFDRDRSGFGRYGGQPQGARGYGGHDRGPAPPQGEQRWGQPQTGYTRGAFGSGSSTYGMGASYSQQGDVAGGASPFGPGSRSGYGGAPAYGAHGGYQDAGPQRSSGAMRRRGPKNYQRSDARLQEIISERLVDDPHVDSSDIDVHVKDGVVKLEGTVDDRRAKYQIEEMLEHIHGVKDVDNHLKVRRGFLAGLFGGGATTHRDEHARHPQHHDGSHMDETSTPPGDSWVYGSRSETERAGVEQDRWQQRSGSTAEALESLKSGTHANPATSQGAPGDATSTGTHVGTTHGSPLMASTADLLNASASGGSSATPAEPTTAPNRGMAEATTPRTTAGSTTTAPGASTGTTSGTTTAAKNAGSGTNGGAAASGPVGVDRGMAEKSAGETRPSKKST